MNFSNKRKLKLFAVWPNNELQVRVPSDVTRAGNRVSRLQLWNRYSKDISFIVVVSHPLLLSAYPSSGQLAPGKQRRVTIAADDPSIVEQDDINVVIQVTLDSPDDEDDCFLEEITISVKLVLESVVQKQANSEGINARDNKYGATMTRTMTFSKEKGGTANKKLSYSESQPSNCCNSNLVSCPIRKKKTNVGDNKLVYFAASRLPMVKSERATSVVNADTVSVDVGSLDKFKTKVQLNFIVNDPDVAVADYLHFRNSKDKSVVYKLIGDPSQAFTFPLTYGVLQPSQSVEIAVYFQALPATTDETVSVTVYTAFIEKKYFGRLTKEFFQKIPDVEDMKFKTLNIACTVEYLSERPGSSSDRPDQSGIVSTHALRPGIARTSSLPSMHSPSTTWHRSETMFESFPSLTQIVSDTLYPAEVSESSLSLPELEAARRKHKRKSLRPVLSVTAPEGRVMWAKSENRRLSTSWQSEFDLQNPLSTSTLGSDRQSAQEETSVFTFTDESNLNKKYQFQEVWEHVPIGADGVRLIRVRPLDVLVFDMKSRGSETTNLAQLTLISQHTKPLIFQVLALPRGHYELHPEYGKLAPATECTVSIFLRGGFYSISNDFIEVRVLEGHQLFKDPLPAQLVFQRYRLLCIIEEEPVDDSQLDIHDQTVVKKSRSYMHRNTSMTSDFSSHSLPSSHQPPLPRTHSLTTKRSIEDLPLRANSRDKSCIPVSSTHIASPSQPILHVSNLHPLLQESLNTFDQLGLLTPHVNRATAGGLLTSHYKSHADAASKSWSTSAIAGSNQSHHKKVSSKTAVMGSDDVTSQSSINKNFSFFPLLQDTNDQTPELNIPLKSFMSQFLPRSSNEVEPSHEKSQTMRFASVPEIKLEDLSNQLKQLEYTEAKQSKQNSKFLTVDTDEDDEDDEESNPNDYESTANCRIGSKPEGSGQLEDSYSNTTEFLNDNDPQSEMYLKESNAHCPMLSERYLVNESEKERMLNKQSSFIAVAPNKYLMVNSSSNRGHVYLFNRSEAILVYQITPTENIRVEPSEGAIKEKNFIKLFVSAGPAVAESETIIIKATQLQKAQVPKDFQNFWENVADDNVVWHKLFFVQNSQQQKMFEKNTVLLGGKLDEGIRHFSGNPAYDLMQLPSSGSFVHVGPDQYLVYDGHSSRKTQSLFINNTSTYNLAFVIFSSNNQVSISPSQGLLTAFDLKEISVTITLPNVFDEKLAVCVLRLDGEPLENFRFFPELWKQASEYSRIVKVIYCVQPTGFQRDLGKEKCAKKGSIMKTAKPINLEEKTNLHNKQKKKSQTGGYYKNEPIAIYNVQYDTPQFLKPPKQQKKSLSSTSSLDGSEAVFVQTRPVEEIVFEHMTEFLYVFNVSSKKILFEVECSDNGSFVISPNGGQIKALGVVHLNVTRIVVHQTQDESAHMILRAVKLLKKRNVADFMKVWGTSSASERMQLKIRFSVKDQPPHLTPPHVIPTYCIYPPCNDVTKSSFDVKQSTPKLNDYNIKVDNDSLIKTVKVKNVRSEFVDIKPEEAIEFEKKCCSEKFIKILNISKYNLAYRILTTSPDCYEISSKFGIICPWDNTVVTVTFTYIPTSPAIDWLTIQALRLPDGHPSVLQHGFHALWEAEMDHNKFQHVLPCKLIPCSAKEISPWSPDNGEVLSSHKCSPCKSKRKHKKKKKVRQQCINGKLVALTSTTCNHAANAESMVSTLTICDPCKPRQFSVNETLDKLAVSVYKFSCALQELEGLGREVVEPLCSEGTTTELYDLMQLCGEREQQLQTLQQQKRVIEERLRGLQTEGEEQVREAEVMGKKLEQSVNQLQSLLERKKREAWVLEGIRKKREAEAYYMKLKEQTMETGRQHFEKRQASAIISTTTQGGATASATTQGTLLLQHTTVDIPESDDDSTYKLYKEGSKYKKVLPLDKVQGQEFSDVMESETSLHLRMNQLKNFQIIVVAVVIVMAVTFMVYAVVRHNSSPE